ncbi:MAG: hypothetical protein EAZ08_13205 [Cytophagales bacterium]|nr:MAG: hypothetical protein EAZ08_13205 [Cytophagales bacterium]
MKKLFLILAVFFLFVHYLSAQNSTTLAQLKYDDAEQAFKRNDFTTCLSKLAEVEEILGQVNPKTLYLKVKARWGYLGKLDLYASRSNYQYVSALQDDCNSYLQKFEIKGLEEKYKDVYKIAESLKASYPTSESRFNELVADREEKERAEAARLQEIRRKEQEAKAAEAERLRAIKYKEEQAELERLKEIQRKKEEAEAKQRREEAEAQERSRQLQEEQRRANELRAKEQQRLINDQSTALIFETPSMTHSIFGISIYSLNRRKFKSYFTARMGFLSLQEIKAIGAPYVPTANSNYVYKGFAISYGMTFPLISPVYGYAGVGASTERLIFEYTNSSDRSKVWGNGLNTQGKVLEDGYAADVDAGIVILPFKYLSAKIGVSWTPYRTYFDGATQAQKDLFQTTQIVFGLGFTFGGANNENWWNRQN